LRKIEKFHKREQEREFFLVAEKKWVAFIEDEGKGQLRFWRDQHVVEDLLCQQ
jgi:hypothetical protein